MTFRKPTWMLPFAAALGASLAAPAALRADGVGEPTPPPVSAAPPPAPRAYAPAPCTGDATIGQVVAVNGSAQAVAPGQAPRALGCDDPLGCEEIVTAPGATLSFLAGDVLVHVAPESRVALGGSESAPELFVERGAVRAVDARNSSAAPVRLAAHDLAASASGADLELATHDGGTSLLCAYDGSAAVDAGPRARTLRAGECLATGADTLAQSPAAAPSLGVDEPGFCSFAVALDDQLTPGDVAAPEAFAFPALAPAGDIDRGPCDKPGSGCFGPGTTTPSGGGGDIPFDDPNPKDFCTVGVSC